MIDLHSHILPGADHGSSGISEAKAQLELIQNAGIHTIVATPHFYPNENSVEGFLDLVNSAAANLTEIVSASPRIALGAEVLFCDNIHHMENLDQLCILASAAAPQTDPAWIDKQTVIALRRGIKPVILLSKSDLRRSDSLLQTYRSIGFETLEISSATGEGVQQVRELLRGKITAFSGNSGIGKSSLLNSLLPQAGAEVGGLGRKVARGKQTTRAVELYPLPEGGYVADTPGFSTFDILKNDDLRKEDLADWFPEMESALGCCRFTGCAHVKEPGCAVKDLVAQGAVPRTRYDSYCSLYAELSKRKSWE
jgi:ribosome biogenesis GTPase